MKSVLWHSRMCCFGMIFLLPKVGSVEIHVSDNVTVKVIDFFFLLISSFSLPIFFLFLFHVLQTTHILAERGVPIICC